MALSFLGSKLPQDHVLSCALGNRARSVSFRGRSFQRAVRDPHLSQMPPHKIDGSREQFFQALSPQIKEGMEAG